MATFIHITDEKYEKSIRTNGIKTTKENKAIFFMPLFDEYLISHQWARELKRFGTKIFIAVHFKIESDELLWLGHFYKEAKEILLTSHDTDELESAFYDFMGKQRKESPVYLERLLDIDDESVLYALVKCIDEFRHPLRKEYLTIKIIGK